MRFWTLAFLAGILFLQPFHDLPALHWIVIFIIFSIAVEIFLVKWKNYFRLLAAAGLGFAWALWAAHSLSSWNLSSTQEGKLLLITGYVASIPNQTNHYVTFLFSLKTIESRKTRTLLKLSWQNNKIPLHAGDYFQLKVRLKRIHGVSNPGGFDYEKWAFQEGIRAEGYVVNDKDNQLLSHHTYYFILNQFREHLKEKMEAVLPHTETSPWIEALALGVRQNISSANWEVLRKTGTNHLMAIAGLHIGFMAGFVFFLVSNGWRRFSYLALYVPAECAGAVAALMMALIYSALAGFSIPTERACIMLSVVLITLVMRRKLLSWHAFCVALLIVLLIQPLSVLSESFWLSFASVVLIIYGINGRLSPKGLWWKLGRIQWVIALGLIPLSIGLFQECSFISFLANSIAIPWVGFLVVPLTLLGCLTLFISTKLSALILGLADNTLSILWKILTYFSHLSWASWYEVIPEKWILIAATLGVVILLLPVGFKGRYVGIIWFLPLIFYHYPEPKKGDLWFTLLDVGQGLSAVLQTKNHILVFDAGARFSDSYDMGRNVVVPFLRSIGAKKIDLLVISHGDNDHMGGADALLHQFKVNTLKTSVIEKFSVPALYCLRGDSWEWDDVQFSFLYPSKDTLDRGNDSSCVLRVTTKNKQRILLT